MPPKGPKPPYMLEVSSPNGQTERAGSYVLVEGDNPNGYPIWKHSRTDNYLYPMLNGRWGIASTKEYMRGMSSLCHIHCPVSHCGMLPHQIRGMWRYWNGSKWTPDKDISVRVLHTDAPRLTLAQALELEDKLIAEYSKEDFQRKLHEAWEAAAGDEIKQKENRTLICLPIQIAVIGKYGFQPSLKGVRDSVRDFRHFEREPGIHFRGTVFNWLMNPDTQKVQEMPNFLPLMLMRNGDEDGGKPVTIAARLFSGKVLATVTIQQNDSIRRVREVIEDAANRKSGKNGQWTGPIKLVYRNEVLSETETVEGAGLSSNSELLVVFLQHFMVLTASDDFSARLFDTSTGSCNQIFIEHNGPVTSAALSHNGSRAATASLDCTVKIFDAETGEFLRTLKGHSKRVNSVVFSPDDCHVLTGSFDCSMKIFSVATGKCTSSFPAGGEPVKTAVFSPDGRSILIAAGDSTAKMYSTSSGAHQQTFRGHGDSVNSAAFSPDGELVVTASSDHTAKVFNAKSGLTDNIMLGHSRAVNNAVFSSDRRQVLSASDDGTVRLFDLVSAGCVQLFKVSGAPVRAALFLPDGRHVLTASDDHLVRLFSITSGECERAFWGHTEPVNALSVSQHS